MFDKTLSVILDFLKFEIPAQVYFHKTVFICVLYHLHLLKIETSNLSINLFSFADLVIRCL